MVQRQEKKTRKWMEVVRRGSKKDEIENRNVWMARGVRGRQYMDSIGTIVEDELSTYIDDMYMKAHRIRRRCRK